MFRVSLRTLFLVTTIVAALASRVEVEARHGPWLIVHYAPQRNVQVLLSRKGVLYHQHPYGGTVWTESICRWGDWPDGVFVLPARL